MFESTYSAKFCLYCPFMDLLDPIGKWSKRQCFFIAGVMIVAFVIKTSLVLCIKWWCPAACRFNYQCLRHNITHHLASVYKLIKQQIQTLFAECFKQAITLLRLFCCCSCIYIIIQLSLSPGPFINNTKWGFFSYFFKYKWLNPFFSLCCLNRICCKNPVGYQVSNGKA